jgi:hypothetical protein
MRVSARRPRKGAPPDYLVWRVETQLAVAADAVEREALQRACFLVATNVRDTLALPDEALIRIYTQDQGGSSAALPSSRTRNASSP